MKTDGLAVGCQRLHRIMAASCIELLPGREYGPIWGVVAGQGIAELAGRVAVTGGEWGT